MPEASKVPARLEIQRDVIGAMVKTLYPIIAQSTRVAIVKLHRQLNVSLDDPLTQDRKATLYSGVQ